MTVAEKHVPVLLSEVMAAAEPGPGQRVVDLTFGAGGYTDAFLKAGAHVVAFDRDPSAIAAGKVRFAAAGDQLTLIEAPFDQLEARLSDSGIAEVDAVVGDFGVSSMQLDEAARGFSFMADGPLDMRMGAGRSAADLLDEVEESDLADILYQYGEERQSRRLARRILSAHQESPLKTTGALAAIAEETLGKASKTHPATRLFQALRIFVNDELGQILRVLMAAERLLKAGGRLVAVSFHSLEDRLVKRFFSAASGKGGAVSRHLPAIGGPEPSFSLPVKPQRAGEQEVASNPRARSATVRSAVRTAAQPLEWTRERLRGLGLPPLVLSPYQQSWSTLS
mgnify:CR=1 FL=1